MKGMKCGKRNGGTTKGSMQKRRGDEQHGREVWIGGRKGGVDWSKEGRCWEVMGGGAIGGCG